MVLFLNRRSSYLEKPIRPVGLTSQPLKTMEGFIPNNLLSPGELRAGPLPVAYQPGRGVDDTAIHLPDRFLSHLENVRAVRVMFRLSFLLIKHNTSVTVCCRGGGGPTGLL